jgi:uncharacterized protein
MNASVAVAWLDWQDAVCMAATSPPPAASGKLACMAAQRIERLSAQAARRVALAAQGFGRARPPAPGRRHLLSLVERLGMLQIDSVNVLARAHYMPAFSRLGAYPREALDGAAWNGRGRALFEYWGHEASLLPVALQPLLRWRMARAERGEGMWADLARFAHERPQEIAAALEEIRERGPLAASELSNAGRSRGGWWGWSDGKRTMEYLFWSGRLAVATRRGTFERVYDLSERVLPAAVMAAPTPSEPEAQRALLRIAARAMGVATGGDLGRYFRLPAADAKARVAELQEAGELLPVDVKEWGKPAYLSPEAVLPRRPVTASCLLSPFDPLLWERDRAERLFGFRYRIEIYTPAHKREHGYYVLPYLLDDALVARVDLKADRAANTLRVLAAHAEADRDRGEIAEALSAELAALAFWLGLERVTVARRGDLAARLGAALARRVESAAAR